MRLCSTQGTKEDLQAPENSGALKQEAGSRLISTPTLAPPSPTHTLGAGEQLVPGEPCPSQQPQDSQPSLLQR